MTRYSVYHKCWGDFETFPTFDAALSYWSADRFNRWPPTGEDAYFDIDGEGRVKCEYDGLTEDERARVAAVEAA